MGCLKPAKLLALFFRNTILSNLWSCLILVIFFLLLLRYCFCIDVSLSLGKIRWVEAILAHLVRCVSGNRGTESDDEDDTIPDHEVSKHWARTRTLSISSPEAEVANARAAANNAPVPKEVTLDYAEISAVPPLPLWLLLAADQRSSNMVDSTTSAADSLFHPTLETHVTITINHASWYLKKFNFTSIF